MLQLTRPVLSTPGLAAACLLPRDREQLCLPAEPLPAAPPELTTAGRWGAVGEKEIPQSRAPPDPQHRSEAGPAQTISWGSYSVQQAAEGDFCSITQALMCSVIQSDCTLGAARSPQPMPRGCAGSRQRH